VVNIGTIIRIAKNTGIAPTAKISGFTINE